MITGLLHVSALAAAPSDTLPGAVAVDGPELAFGLLSGGVVIYTDGTLRLADGRRVPDLFRGTCRGVQIGRTGLILLGEEEAGAFGQAARTSLLYLPTRDTDTHIPPFRIPLGEGVWSLVRGSRSDSVMVYDRSGSTARGAKAIRASTGELLWETGDGTAFRRMRWAGPRALGLTEDGELVAVHGRKGAISERRSLPAPPEGGRWTAWTGTLDDLVLAGANRSTFVVGAVDGDGLRDVHEIPVDEAFDDDPAALPSVAAVEDLGDGSRLLILGGDGETAADESTRCVAAIVDDAGWSIAELDPDRGCCAVLDYDGGWLVQCGHGLMHVRVG